MLLPLLAALLISPPDSTWTKTDTWLLVGASVAMVSDCTTSSMGIQQHKMTEGNSFLGRKPTPLMYVAACVWSVGTTALVATTLPKKIRRIGLIVLGSIEIVETSRTLLIRPRIQIRF